VKFLQKAGNYKDNYDRRHGFEDRSKDTARDSVQIIAYVGCHIYADWPRSTFGNGNHIVKLLGTNQTARNNCLLHEGNCNYPAANCKKTDIKEAAKSARFNSSYKVVTLENQPPVDQFIREMRSKLDWQQYNTYAPWNPIFNKSDTIIVFSNKPKTL
jgi:hypothetical protein